MQKAIRGHLYSEPSYDNHELRDRRHNFVNVLSHSHCIIFNTFFNRCLLSLV